MPRMPDIEAEARGAVGWAEHAASDLFRRNHDQPVPATQEQTMSRITDARAAIAHADTKLAEMAGSALAEAIADAGLGTHFADPEIRLVLAMISAIEHGPQVTVMPPPAPDAAAFPPAAPQGT